MLESFFTYPGVLARMRRGPLADEIDAIADDFERAGYARLTAIRYLSLAASFSRYAEDGGCTNPEEIDRALTECFLAQFPASRGTGSLARTATEHVLRHLQRRYPGMTEAATLPADPDDKLLAAFDDHMRDVRGLQQRSSEEVVRLARRMLAWYRERHSGRPLSNLCGTDVVAFVAEVATEDVASRTRAAMMSHTRGFLRFLRWAGVLQADLACHVPRAPCWRFAEVPTHLTWEDVRRVIDSIDPAEPIGKRDRALLLLLATTGMRNQEVRLLELRDVRWRVSELYLRRTKTRRERAIPLAEEAGAALADYVLRGRPQTALQRVFLRHRAPVGPLCSSGTVSCIVRRRLADCDIRLSRAGAHLFRHSLATRLVQQECPVKEVADLLGHRSIDTTAIYVKVALPQLAAVALPFPGGSA